MTRRYRRAQKHKTPLSYWAAEFQEEREEESIYAPIPLLSGDKRYTFTVMAGYGVGEFLWGKDSADSSCLVGVNIYSLMEEGCYSADISVDLFLDFCQWAHWYMNGQPEDWGYPWEIDWDAFNREGLRLARRLKAELGDTADVQYVRPFNDPNSVRGEVTVITVAEAGSDSVPLTP